MRANNLGSNVIVALSFLFFTLQAYAEKITSPDNIDIPFSGGNIILDGKLNDELWEHAKDIDLNLVNFPSNNTPSPIKTTAKIVENGKNLFIAFIAEDPNPADIQSYYADRDNRWDDDLVGIKLDPQNNHRLNYEFIVNPLGMQMDSIQNHLTGEKNTLWDGIWHSYGRLTKTGFVVEMQIPFRILNFNDNNTIKTWPFELFRIYPRDTWLRISHVKLDKDIACKTCQYPTAKGFQQASSNESLMITPAIVAKSEHVRDIYDPQDDWHQDDSIEVSGDLRLNINSNTLLNATINPDFSIVEADAAQLNVNENFTLNYDEKRQFFLENSEYFSSNFDLIYTRNIADPDYGVKLTGAKNDHTYGLFMAHDSQTNFILPGNLSSDIVNLNEESHSSAVKYRYDVDTDISLGLISTMRKSDSYHNYVTGIDAKYQITDSNSLLAQWVTSDTQYPTELYKDFCQGIDCIEQLSVSCQLLECPYSEQVNRANYQQSFTDQAMKVDFQHRSENWHIDATHLAIGDGFRADLGFMPKADFKEDSVEINRIFFSEQNTFWQEATLTGYWDIKHNENNEFIAKTIKTAAAIDGPYQSKYKITYSNSNEVGLRFDRSITDIDNNTSRFSLTSVEYFAAFKPHNSLYVELKYINGDKIDYIHNRSGKLHELESYFSWFANQHLEIELTHVNSHLESEGSNVYDADLLDLRMNYQFNARSQLKLSLIYCDIARNLDNNPSGLFDERKKALTSQLIYSYKLNPQTVFYLGYSDNSYQDDYLDDLTRENKTFFSKISYAWLP